MRGYKVIFIFLLTLLMKQQVQAQIHVFAGPQMTSAKYSIRNVKQPTEFKPGFMVGVSLHSLIEGPLYFAPSLYYSRKGYKVSFNRPGLLPDTAALNNNTSINTIAFAPLLHFDLSKTQNHFFVRFGPGLDVAFSGREVFDSTRSKKVDRSMSFSSVAYSPATAYATVQFGYQYGSGLNAFAYYEHGLSNFNNSDFGPMILHRVAGLTLGWRF